MSQTRCAPPSHSAPVAPSEKKPSARTLRHQRITGQIHPLLPAKTFRSGASVTDSFLSSKRDRRLIKHSSFVSRVASTSRVAKASERRTRRPARKLRTDLDALADALPDIEAGDAGPRDGKVRHRSLRSRKGALKRKERVVKGEMERFGVSMARLAGIQGESAGESTTQSTTPGAVFNASEGQKMAVESQKPASTASSNRWAALRGYISSTMEQNPAFANKTT